MYLCPPDFYSVRMSRPVRFNTVVSKRDLIATNMPAHAYFRQLLVFVRVMQIPPVCDAYAAGANLPEMTKRCASILCNVLIIQQKPVF